MGSDFYFYEQCDTRVVPKRYRKLPQELPESLRFAHLNPKVAALLASKERGQRLDNEDPFGDGMGKKSLLPDINASFTNIRNQFDSAMSNDEDSQRYLFEEAKLSAPQVLLQLSRIIYFYENLYKHIPRSLEYHLMSGYEEFTKDIVVVPREWQTQEMKAQYANKVQQQEAISEEEMSENELTGRSRSRLLSERSSEVGSKMNVRKSKQKLGSVLDVSECNEPGLLGRRSESRVSMAPSQFRGTLDVGNLSRVGSRRKGSISGQSRRFRDDNSLIAETPTDLVRSTAMANQLSYMQTINFQLSNKSFEDKGWIRLKGRQEEVDQNTVLEYCVTRLQESMKDITNQRQKYLDQGYDKSVTVRYYGDSRKETLLKYRKAQVKVTSSLSIQKGAKPRIPSIIDESSEGRLLMQASHIDGSTVIYYQSGRPAIIYSAAGFGRPGYYTIVYEDELDSKMLGCFTPSGRGVCYYSNGVVRFLATEKGGHLAEENGKLIRKWKWPHTNVKITEPINFQINNHLTFRCVGQNQMIIVFNSQKESARFSVGPTPEAEEYRPFEETDQLLTAFTFSSRAAKDLMRIFAPKKQKKKTRKKKKRKTTDQEVEKKESESLKQVQFSHHTMEVSTGPKFASAFRRMSISPGRDTKQPKKTQLGLARRLSSSTGESTQNLVKDHLLTGRRMSLSPRTDEQPFKKQQLSNRRLSFLQGTEASEAKRQQNNGQRRRMSYSPGTDTQLTKNQSITSRRMSYSATLETNKSKTQQFTGRQMSPGAEPMQAKTQSVGRRMSYTPSTETQQAKNKPISGGTLTHSQDEEGKNVKKQPFAFSRTSYSPDRQNQQVKKPTDLFDKESKQNKQTQDLNKRAKSARQVSIKESKDGKKESFSSSTKVISSKSSTVDKHVKKDMKADEGMFKDKAQNYLISENDIKPAQAASNIQPKLKVPTSILKNSPSRQMDGVSFRKSDHKDARASKSAKLKSPSSAFQDLDKRAQSAITTAISSADDSDADRNGRHKSSATTFCEDGGSKESLYTRSEEDGSEVKNAAFKDSCRSVLDQDITESENGDLSRSPESTVHFVPFINIINPSGDEDEDDEHEENSEDFVESDKNEENSEDTVENEENSENSVENEENEENTDVSDERNKDTDDDSITDTNDEERSDTYDEEAGIPEENETAIENEAFEDTHEADDVVPDVAMLRQRRAGYIFDHPDEKTDTANPEEEKEEGVVPALEKYVANDETKKAGNELERSYDHSPRQRSVLMKSIVMFRKKILAKKGIVVSSSSETCDNDSDSDHSQTSKSQTSDIIKLLQDFPDKVSYDIEAEKELLRLQRKARNLIDDWMEHYRIALGFKSPLLQSVADMPLCRSSPRNIKSAKTSNHLLMIRKAVLGLDFDDDTDHSTSKKNRIPSAPLKGELELDEELQDMLAEKQQTVKFNKSSNAAEDGRLSPSALTTLNRLADTASRRSARSKVSSARSGSPSRPAPGPPTERVPSATSGSRSFCPLVIRQQKLNYERPQCRCSRHHIPFIMDIELDDFVGMETQEGQMVVIMIVSSLRNIKNKVTNVDYDFYINKEGVPFHRVFPGITKSEEMLNEIYVNQNRNRTRPCVQSRMDMFRIFKYDINSAAEMSNHTTPLLMTRHNVVPGMFLIYCDGKLLFCDHIFNGYGNARKDFKKQVMKCRHDSIQGLYLPKDFRFSPSKGKSGLRSAWGGEIGGAGVDKYSSSGTVVDTSLQPIHRPTSTPDSSEISQTQPYDAVKSTNRRPFLPRIDVNQTGPGQLYPSESVSNWLSTNQPGSKTNTFSTTTSYPNSLSETY